MKVEVVYGLYEKQYFYSMDVDVGTTVGEAIKLSPLLREFPDLDLSHVGIFSIMVPLDKVLREGDRVEVYRPLQVDAKQKRRSIAKENEQAGA